MKKLFILTTLILSCLNISAKDYDLGNVVEFYAFNNDVLCQSYLGDWSLAFYREDVDYHVIEIDIHNGDSHRIAGYYEVDPTQYEDEVRGYSAVTLSDNGTLVSFNHGNIEVTYLYTDAEGNPVYRIVGKCYNTDGDTVNFDYTIPCTSAIDTALYQQWHAGDVWINYHMVLLDDPEAVDPQMKNDATGEVRELYAYWTSSDMALGEFERDYGYIDYTSSTGGYWQMMGHTSDNKYLVCFSPSNATSMYGAYTAKDMYQDYTYIEYYKNGDILVGNKQVIFIQEGQIVVSKSAYGPVLEADVLGYDGIEYKILLAHKTVVNAGIQDLNADPKLQVRKQLKGRQVYIIKDGKTYNAAGSRMK